MSKETVPNETGMVKVEPSGLIRPVASTHDLIGAHKEWAKVIQEVLEPGRDYGTIPGTGDKPTLLKPGAERLALAARFAATFDIISEEIDHDRKVEWTKHSRKFGAKSGTSFGLYRYAVRCKLLLKGTGELVGEGVGSASSLESKYVERPRDVENTVFKIAKKRAFVDAVLTTLALSDRFTQDVEDMAPPPRSTPAARPEAVADAEVVDDDDGPFTDDTPAVGPTISDKQVKLLFAKLYEKYQKADFAKAKSMLENRFAVPSLDKIPALKFNEVLAWIEAQGAH